MSPKPAIRCAIYTRKSSDEGLDQAFNSLDAQHEACAAYVASQRHEGWVLAPARFDDGGLSGGTLARPALQRLLAEIDAGGIGMVVVYKIDRLTRSLADFGRLVERLDAKGCSFVSVTQAFNTATSMGRLTLNVLLSFAQFEREVTAERIRDKIAASKKKGMWMGGTVPLGYDRHPDPGRRELVVNDGEAEVVRTLFGFYETLGCLRRVTTEARTRGLRSKRHVSAEGGCVTGDQPLSRGQLHYLLTNPTYRGLIRHKALRWPGLHPAIVDEATWDRVQARLQAASGRKRNGGKEGAIGQGGGATGASLATGDAADVPGSTQAASRGVPATEPALLIGLLRDETDDRLTPTHTLRRGRRMRYYVSNRLIAGGRDPSGWRLPGPALEATVTRLLAEHLADCAQMHRLLAAPEAGQMAAVAGRARDLAARLLGGEGGALQRGDESHGPRACDSARATASKTLLRTLLATGVIARDRVTLTLDAGMLAAELQVEVDALSAAVLTCSTPLALRRRGVETRLVAGTPAPAADATLVRALARAHCWVDALRTGVPLAALARAEGCTESYVRIRASLAFLVPQIQAAILGGTQPPDLTLERILRTGVPIDWAEQVRVFKIAG